MLLPYRDNISLEVYYTGAQVQIIPPRGEFDHDHFIHSFALGEQLLAQLFLNHAPRWNPGARLGAFFRQRGWQVREEEASP